MMTLSEGESAFIEKQLLSIMRIHKDRRTLKEQMTYQLTEVAYDEIQQYRETSKAEKGRG